MISKDKPLVTIYIVSKNYGRFLNQSIKSVLDQTYKNWELFVVDDNSDDETTKIMNKYKNYKDNIKFIFNSKNIGLQRTANTILSKSLGKYFIRLDADDWLEKNAIELMINILEKKNNLEIVFGNYNFTNEYGEKIGTDKKYDYKERTNLKHFPVHGACTMFRVKTLKKVGGYNEKFKAQDGWEIWQKIAKKNKIFHIKKTLFNYRQHNNSLSVNKSKILKYRNLIFKDLSKKLKKNKLNCLAIIPVKENYKSFFNVPFLKIGKKNLLDKAIDCASNSNKVNKIAITTSSKKVIDYLNKKKNKSHKNLFLVKRNEEKKSKYADIRKIILDTSKRYEKKYKKKLDLIVYLSIHAPFRTSNHIDEAINVLQVNNCDTVFSVNIEYDPIFKFSKKGINVLNPGRFDELNFERETLLKYNGSILLTKYRKIKKSKLFAGDLGYLEMTNEESQQIKSYDDYIRIKNLLKKK